jgi:hypothetical protein
MYFGLVHLRRWVTRNATVWREEEKATVVIYVAYSTSFSGASISIFKLVFKLKFNPPVSCLGRTLVCTQQWLFCIFIRANQVPGQCHRADGW